MTQISTCGAPCSTVRSELVKAGRAPGTINQWRVVVRGLWGTRKGSPALGWDWKALSTDPKDDLAFYTPDEAARLVAAAEDDTDAAIFTLAVQAGPRKSEIRALRVKDCDFAGGLLRFARGYTNEEGFAANKGKELRSVPMSPEVAGRLRPLCEGKAPDDRVFEPERGAQAICGSALYRRFVDAADRAGLRRIRFHDLRHSFGTQAIQGFDIYKVQRWLGHKSIATTEKYLHYQADAPTPAPPRPWEPCGRPAPRPMSCRSAARPERGCQGRAFGSAHRRWGACRGGRRTGIGGRCLGSLWGAFPFRRRSRLGKSTYLQANHHAGGGTRTPDTRIMIWRIDARIWRP
ncbi:MAG: site-specific integrase [Solirubrobacterales bacterium]|jgi:integrase|nr:site-specific integrase [Solirubrobacterales bacterium]